MRVRRFDVLTIEIPMRFGIRHALAERTLARNVIVRAVDESGIEGYGECCPRPYVTGETVEGARRELLEMILPQFLHRELPDLDATHGALTAVLDEARRDQQAAFCAAELAILDLAGKLDGRSAGSVLGPLIRHSVRYSGVIATDDLDEVLRKAELMRDFEIGDVKVKVGASLANNLAILECARDTLGPDVTLRIDANCVWSADEALRQLEAMGRFGLVGVEQPVPEDDRAGLARVTAARLAPVVVDESLCTMDDARELVRLRACDIFNVRISKCGGLINSGRIQRIARDAGLGCQLGAQVGETGFLSAAGRHFSTRCPDLLWFEGSFASMLLEEDVTTPELVFGPGGHAAALVEPGLGVEPVDERMRRFTRKSTTLE